MLIDEFIPRQPGRNQNQPRRAQSNFLADFAKIRRKRLKNCCKTKTKQISPIYPFLFFKEKGLGDEFFISNATSLDLLEEVSQGSINSTQTNPSVRRVIFSQITPIFAEKD
ncbi:hypothetical protein ACX8XP_09315 [Calditrichota bacterium LG25]